MIAPSFPVLFDIKLFSKYSYDKELENITPPYTANYY
jgi:hypothetical protein